MRSYRISQLAERTGVPASTLRFYEQEGLLAADRSPAGYRLYDDAAVDRLGFIAAGKHLGLPLGEIRELLVVWESSPCAQVQDRLRPMLRAGVVAAHDRIEEMGEFTARLQRALSQLDEPSRDGRCDPSCEFLLMSTALPTDTAVPVACTASPGDRDRQVLQWRTLVAQGKVTRSSKGARLTLPIGMVAEVAQLAADEQACCPFFDMRLDLVGPLIHLTIQAPRHATELLDELLGGAAPAPVL